MAGEVDGNVALLADTSVLGLCGKQRPTAFFAYPGKPSLPEAPDGRVIELCSIDMDYAWTLQALAEALAAEGDLPEDAFQPTVLPPLPTGR